MKDESTDLPFSGLELSERDRKRLRAKMEYSTSTYVLAGMFLVLGVFYVFGGWDAIVAYIKWLDERPTVVYPGFPYNDAKDVFFFIMGVLWLLLAAVYLFRVLTARLFRRLSEAVDKSAARSREVGPPKQEDSPRMATP